MGDTRFLTLETTLPHYGHPSAPAEKLETEANQQAPSAPSEEEWAELLGTPAAREAFSVRDEQTADWLVRKIQESRARRLYVNEWAQLETERAQRNEDGLLAHFGAQLEAFVRAQVADGKRRSISLPAGTVGFRKSPARLFVYDESAAIAWAKANCPVAVVEVPASAKLSKTDLINATKNSGEVPDGASWEAGTDAMYIK